MDEADELRALRARAYGRDADIDADAAAMARLVELEHRNTPARPGRPPAPHPALLPDPGDDASPGGLAGRQRARRAAGDLDGPRAPAAPALPDLPLPEAEVDDGDREPPAPPEPRPTGIRRLLDPLPSALWLWWGVACIALTAVGAAAIAFAISPPDPRQVAVIAIDTDATWPDLLGERGPDAALFEEFYGLTIIRDIGWLSEDTNRMPCLVIVRTEQLLDEVGALQPVTWGCGAGRFPPTLQLTVTPSQPEALRERFAEGTGLQFVMRGDTIEVRADR